MKNLRTPFLPPNTTPVTIALAGVFAGSLLISSCAAPGAEMPDSDSGTPLPLIGDELREEERPQTEDGRPHPHGAVARWSQRLSEDGTVPHNAIVRMKQQRDYMLQNRPEMVSFLHDWKWLGPGNRGGRVRSIVIHPNNTNTMWCGSVGGGIWKTTDGGASWAAQDDFAPMMSVGCMAIDKTDPDRLYAGSGEGFFDTVAGSGILAASRGAGLFTTTNGGTTWTQMPATNTPDFYFVNRIAISPADPKIILIATASGIWRTTDRGVTFTKVDSHFAMDVAYHPTNALLAVAGTRDGLPKFSRDGGLTWGLPTGIPTSERTEICYSQSSPNIVYCARSQAGRITVYRSTNGGRDYTRTTGGSGISTYSRYNNTLWVDPSDSNHILVGGVRLFKSTNGGASFVSAYSGSYYDYHVIVSHPNYNGAGNRTVFHGNDGGVYRTTDVRASSIRWQELNNNLGITQFYGAAMAPNGNVVGGTQDLGTIVYRGNPQGWTNEIGGDGCYCAADPTNSNIMYGQIYYIWILRSTNGGNSFSTIARNTDIPDRGSNFIPYLTLDPNDPKRMYFCAASLWRTDNVRDPSRPTWREVKPALTCPGPIPAHFRSDPLCNISVCQVAKGNPTVVWAGHNHGHIYMTTNALAATPTWTRVDTAAMPKRWVGSIAIDPRDHNTVYVSFLGYHRNNVWVTRDAGSTWNPINGSGATALPESPVNWVTVNPLVPGCLFAGTDIGLFYSRDDGTTWETDAAGSRTAPIAELQWKNDNTLIITTHGRGIYTVEIGDPAESKNIGGGCGTTSAPSLNATAPRPGTTQNYAIASTTPNAPVLLMFGASTQTVSIGNGCTLHVDLGASRVVMPGSTNSAGTLSYAIPIPRSKDVVGLTATVQAALLKNGGPALGVAELSNGVELTGGF